MVNARDLKFLGEILAGSSPAIRTTYHVSNHFKISSQKLAQFQSRFNFECVYKCHVTIREEVMSEQHKNLLDMEIELEADMVLQEALSVC